MACHKAKQSADRKSVISYFDLDSDMVISCLLILHKCFEAFAIHLSIMSF